jgi:hypothetical protein
MGWTNEYDGASLAGVRLTTLRGQYSGRATVGAWTIEVNAQPGLSFVASHHWTTYDEYGVPIVSGPIVDVGRGYAGRVPMAGQGRWRLTVNDMSFILKAKLLPALTISNHQPLTRDVTEYARSRAIWLIGSHFPSGLISSDYTQIASGGTSLLASEHLVFNGQSGVSLNFQMRFAGMNLWAALDSIFTMGGFLWYLQPDPANPMLSRIVSYDPATRNSATGITDSATPSGSQIAAAEMDIHDDASHLVNALRVLYVPIGSEYAVEVVIENSTSIAECANMTIGDDGRRWDVLNLPDCPTEALALSLGNIYMRWRQKINVRGTAKCLWRRIGMTIIPGMTVPLEQIEHGWTGHGNVNSMSIEFANTIDNLPEWITYNFNQDPYTWPTSVGGWLNDPIKLGTTNPHVLTQPWALGTAPPPRTPKPAPATKEQVAWGSSPTYLFPINFPSDGVGQTPVHQGACRPYVENGPAQPAVPETWLYEALSDEARYMPPLPGWWDAPGTWTGFIYSPHGKNLAALSAKRLLSIATPWLPADHKIISCAAMLGIKQGNPSWLSRISWNIGYTVTADDYDHLRVTQIGVVQDSLGGVPADFIKNNAFLPDAVLASRECARGGASDDFSEPTASRFDLDADRTHTTRVVVPFTLSPANAAEQMSAQWGLGAPPPAGWQYLGAGLWFGPSAIAFPNLVQATFMEKGAIVMVNGHSTPCHLPLEGVLWNGPTDPLHGVRQDTMAAVTLSYDPRIPTADDAAYALVMVEPDVAPAPAGLTVDWHAPAWSDGDGIADHGIVLDNALSSTVRVRLNGVERTQGADFSTPIEDRYGSPVTVLYLIGIRPYGLIKASEHGITAWSNYDYLEVAFVEVGTP